MSETCVFFLEKTKCPVMISVKEHGRPNLQTLVQFCEICPNKPAPHWQTQDMALVFLQMTQNMAQLNRELGKAEVYRELYLKLREEHDALKTLFTPQQLMQIRKLTSTPQK